MDKDCNKLDNKWENLDNDILVMIFKRYFNIFELTSGLAHVCQRWRVACCDPILWNTLDLSIMKSTYIKTPREPYVYVERRSDYNLTRILKLSLNLSQGNVKTLIFHFNLFVSDEQLTYTAERCPKLKRLVLPAWNRIKKTGITQAISIWKDLESLTMPSILNPPYLIKSISENCKNFSHLKIMGPFEILFADTLVQYLPNLKVLSLRCTAINRDALITILDGLPGLEILNISHSYLVVKTKQQNLPQILQKKITREVHEIIVEKAARLKKFMTCMECEICEMCKRTEKDEGILRWYKYEETDWKADEVSSLHL